MSAGALFGLVLAIGCGKKAGPETSAPAGEATYDAMASEEGAESPEPRSLEELEAQLLDYEDGLLGVGIDLPDGVKQARVDAGAAVGTPADGGATPPEQRCERICELAANICGLRDHICDLADEHATDARYAKACERATQDCERAEKACEDCSE